MATHLRHYYLNSGTLLSLVVSFGAIMIIGVPVQTNSIYAIEEIPQAKCIYDGQEYIMNSHLIKKQQEINRLDFPELPDNYNPQMILEKGETITMEFDGDKPTELKAYLVDYDADITETYPLKVVDENTFEVTETGIKTLEAIATFADNTQISYTLLIDVDD